jgi:hypothetical protein
MEAVMTVPDRCSVPVQGARPCVRSASTVIDGSPVCWQHAAAAARKAAEAAREAAYWEEMFAPRPGEPYRTDPEWQAAVRVMLTDPQDGDDDDGLVRRIDAIYRRYEIERRAEASASSAAPCAPARTPPRPR